MGERDSLPTGVYGTFHINRGRHQTGSVSPLLGNLFSVRHERFLPKLSISILCDISCNAETGAKDSGLCIFLPFLTCVSFLQASSSADRVTYILEQAESCLLGMQDDCLFAPSCRVTEQNISHLSTRTSKDRDGISNTTEKNVAYSSSSVIVLSLHPGKKYKRKSKMPKNKCLDYQEML